MYKWAKLELIDYIEYWKKYVLETSQMFRSISVGPSMAGIHRAIRSGPDFLSVLRRKQRISSILWLQKYPFRTSSLYFV